LQRESAENKFPVATPLRSGHVKIFLLVTVNVYYPENPSGFASCCINFRKRKLPVKVHSSTELVARTFAKLHYATESHSVHRMKAVKPSLSKTLE